MPKYSLSFEFAMETLNKFSPFNVLLFKNINISLFSTESINLDQIETLSKITKKMTLSSCSKKYFNEIKKKEKKEQDSQSVTELLVIDGDV
jgi:hypothetical protein